MLLLLTFIGFVVGATVGGTAVKLENNHDKNTIEVVKKDTMYDEKNQKN